MKKISKVIYNLFFSLVIALAILLLFSTFPITGNYKILVVKSGSMEPAIHTGSIIFTKPVKDYQIGDIVTFTGTNANDRTPITHRISDIRLQEGKAIYTTKGDANNSPDQREIQYREIIGKLLFSVPFVGYALDAVRQPMGFIFVIVVPALFIIYDEINKIKKEVGRMRNKKQKLDEQQDKEISKIETELEILKRKIFKGVKK